MKSVRLIAMVTSFIISLLTISNAEVPKLINYQGHLTDKGGNPLTGTASITFTIYDTASGTNALWSEIQEIVAVNNGIFNVLLGTATVGGVPENVFDGLDRWLGIAISGDSEMSPRQQLVSVPYAYNVERLNGQDGSYYLDSNNFTGTNWNDLTDGGQCSLHTHMATTGNLSCITIFASPPDEIAYAYCPSGYQRTGCSGGINCGDVEPYGSDGCTCETSGGSASVWAYCCRIQ